MVLHGATMFAYDLYPDWSAVADANDIIMVFPQCSPAWKEDVDSNGFHQRFFRKLAERITSPLDANHEYEIALSDQIILSDSDDYNLNSD